MTHPKTAGDATSTGLSANTEGALAYLLGPITGVLFLVLEKENRFVRYHAAQSIVVGVLLIVTSMGLSIASTVLAFVPVLGWLVALLLSLVLGVGSFILWLALMWRAFMGERWELPVARDLARRLASEGRTP
jgi:uncharacterized membrane protein